MHLRASKRAPVVAVNLREFLLWVLRRRLRVRVDGISMEPSLRPGTTVLIQTNASVQVNDIVLSRHPYNPEVQVLKRVAEIHDEGVFLLGDNPAESTDSRSFGVIPWEHIIGRVTSKID